jgi:hypothetical protein
VGICERCTGASEHTTLRRRWYLEAFCWAAEKGLIVLVIIVVSSLCTCCSFYTFSRFLSSNSYSIFNPLSTGWPGMLGIFLLLRGLSKHTDMPNHWKALEECFLTEQLVFRFHLFYTPPFWNSLQLHWSCSIRNHWNISYLSGFSGASFRAPDYFQPLTYNKEPAL